MLKWPKAGCVFFFVFAAGCVLSSWTQKILCYQNHPSCPWLLWISEELGCGCKYEVTVVVKQTVLEFGADYSVSLLFISPVDTYTLFLMSTRLMFSWAGSLSLISGLPSGDSILRLRAFFSRTNQIKVRAAWLIWLDHMWSSAPPDWRAGRILAPEAYLLMFLFPCNFLLHVLKVQ